MGHKTDHHAFANWKELSEKTKEDWDNIQLSFMRVGQQHFKGKHEVTDKFRTANMQGKKGRLSTEDHKTHKEAVREGEDPNDTI